MGCCEPGGYDDFFTERIAARDERRYRERGLDPVARRVVDAARAYGVEGATVLELRGGIGALRLELLKAGAARADAVPAADFVVLHKVVCCYPDHGSLVAAAAARARRVLLLTFPRDAWWNRVGFRAINALQRLRRQSFRVYVHPPDAVLAVAEREGLRPNARAGGAVWLFAALER